MIVWVAEDNIASNMYFLKNNYLKMDETKKYYFEFLNKEVTMKKCVYEIKS